MNLHATLVDTTMIRMAETILAIAGKIESGEMSDVGTVTTLRIVAASIVNATQRETANDNAG